MSLQIYRITTRKIQQVEKFTPKEVIIVYNDNSNKIFLYKGEDSLNLNEFDSNKIYERVINQFLTTKVFLITHYQITKDDSSEIAQVKNFIANRISNKWKYKLKKILRNIFLLQFIRDGWKEFRNYESSHTWRSKLSNTTTLWKLSLFNILFMGILIVILLLELSFGIFPVLNTNLSSLNEQIWKENLILVISVCIILIILIFVINLLFVLFPMKFPIKPAKYIDFIKNPPLDDSNPKKEDLK